MTSLRALLTVGLFLVGVVAGAGTWLVASRPPDQLASRFPSLAKMAEPPVGEELRSALEHSDSLALSVLLTTDQMDQLKTALSPVTTVSEVRHAGTVQRGSQTVIGYLVRGLDQQGSEAVVGLVVTLQDNALDKIQ